MSMKQTRGLFCMCKSGVACCQPQQQCHFWPLNSKRIAWVQVSLAAVNHIYVFYDSLKACFENVNIFS